METCQQLRLRRGGLLRNLLALSLFGYAAATRSNEAVNTQRVSLHAHARNFMAGRAAPTPPLGMVPPAAPAPSAPLFVAGPSPAPGPSGWEEGMFQQLSGQLNQAAADAQAQQTAQITMEANVVVGKVHAMVSTEVNEANASLHKAYGELLINSSELKVMENESLAHAQEMLDRGTKEVRVMAQKAAQDELTQFGNELDAADEHLQEDAGDMEKAADFLIKVADEAEANANKRSEKFKDELDHLPIKDAEEVVTLAATTEKASAEVLQSANAARGMSKLVNMLALKTVALEEDARSNAESAQNLESQSLSLLKFNSQQMTKIKEMSDSTIKQAGTTSTEIASSQSE